MCGGCRRLDAAGRGSSRSRPTGRGRGRGRVRGGCGTSRSPCRPNVSRWSVGVVGRVRQRRRRPVNGRPGVWRGHGSHVRTRPRPVRDASASRSASHEWNSANNSSSRLRVALAIASTCPADTAPYGQRIFERWQRACTLVHDRQRPWRPWTTGDHGEISRSRAGSAATFGGELALTSGDTNLERVTPRLMGGELAGQHRQLVTIHHVGICRTQRRNRCRCREDSSVVSNQ